MFLTRLMFAARRRAGRAPAAALEALPAPEEFQRILIASGPAATARARSSRWWCSRSAGEPAGRDALAHLARILQKRLRLSDDAGRLADRQIGVVVAGHAGRGGVDRGRRRVRVRPGRTAAAGLHRLLLPVRLADGRGVGGRDGEYEDPEAERPVRPMETAFRPAAAGLEAGCSTCWGRAGAAGPLAVAGGGGRGDQAHLAGPGLLPPEAERAGGQGVRDAEVPLDGRRRRGPQAQSGGA